MDNQILGSTGSVGATMIEARDFVGYRAANTGAFHVDCPVGIVFPLFGPAEEAKWAPGWQPHWLFPEKSFAESHTPERGWVFKTDRRSPEERVWFVEKFDAVGYQAVYRVHWPGHMLYRIEVTSVPSEHPRSRKSGTLTTVTYDFIGVSEAGNREVREMTAHPAEYAREMKRWARFISGCLQKPKTRRHDHAQATAQSTY